MTRRVGLFLSAVKQINTVFARFVYFLFSHRTISIRSQNHIIPLYQFPAILSLNNLDDSANRMHYIQNTWFVSFRVTKTRSLHEWRSKRKLIRSRESASCDFIVSSEFCFHGLTVKKKYFGSCRTAIYNRCDVPREARIFKTCNTAESPLSKYPLSEHSINKIWLSASLIQYAYMDKS